MTAGVLILVVAALTTDGHLEFLAVAAALAATTLLIAAAGRKQS